VSPTVPSAAPVAGDPHDRPPWSFEGRKVAAWIALVSLALMVVAIVVLALKSIVEILAMILFAALAGVGVWWAALGTTVRRRFGLALAALGVVALVVCLVLLAFQSPVALIALIACAVVFGFFSTRALHLMSRYRRFRENRVALPRDASRAPTELEPVTQPSGLIVNEKSGGGKAAQVGLVDEARRLGIDTVVLGPGDDLVELAEGLIAGGAEVLGMAGGDGSLGLVADVARRHGIPFVCVPVGTRNHFARDLGLDRSYPLHALGAFNGPEITIDVAIVTGGNGEERTFLNNATFGVYADMVADPDYRDAKLETAQKLISEIVNGERQPSPLDFNNADGTAFDSAFLIMIAVGNYELDSITDIGVRSALDDGVLQVSVLEPSDEPDLRRLTTAAVLGSLQNADGFWQWNAESFEVSSSIGLINLGVDGESMQWASPVTARVEPHALRVRVPELVEPVPGPQAQPLSATVSDLWKVATGSS
jgi:diacylglycerol kinase family enzyme